MSTGSKHNAVIAAAIGWLQLLQFSGCLNPRPEELPSSAELPPEPALAEPARESCEDNPLLAGCDVPSADINADPANEEPADEAERPVPLGGPGAEEAGAPDAAASDAGAPDAGATEPGDPLPEAASDAGVP